MTPLVPRRVLDLTDQVQAAIDGGDWQRASELDTERRALLEQLAWRRSRAISSTTLAALERNHRLIGRVEHHKRRILRDASIVTNRSDGAAPTPTASAVTTAVDGELHSRYNQNFSSRMQNCEPLHIFFARLPNITASKLSAACDERHFAAAAVKRTGETCGAARGRVGDSQ